MIDWAMVATKYPEHQRGVLSGLLVQFTLHFLMESNQVSYTCLSNMYTTPLQNHMNKKPQSSSNPTL